MIRHGRRGFLAAMAVVLGAGACSSGMQTESSGSRARVYGSLEELRADSDLVVEVVVGSAGEPDDPSSRVQATVGLVSVEGTADRGSAELPATGSGITVIQDVSTSEATAHPLEEGGTYILFLTRVGLEGGEALRFFVTGIDAGIFALAADGTSYAYQGTAADDLPATATAAELFGS